LKVTKASILFFTALLTALSLSTCTSEKGTPDYNKYPDDVGRIMFTKCAVAGCHTSASKGAAGGLNLESWDELFKGGTGSAAVIPFRHDFSTLQYYINTFPELGVTLSPTMPYNKPPLSKEEVLIIQNWIDAGAPNRDGQVKFSDNPSRKKIYIPNQGCDVVTVMDQATLLPMRYITVGSSTSTESPHMVKVSPDGMYWYVIFLASNYIEKYRTSDDSFVGRALIGPGSWNTFSITGDSQTAYCVDFSNSGKVAIVDLDALTATTQAPFNNPHGSALTPDDDTLYVTAQQGSQLYKIPVADFSGLTMVNLYTGATPPSALQPHEIKFSPDNTKYFVTCQGTSNHDVRVFQAGTDQLLAVIPVGDLPSEMSVSTDPSKPYLFVSCSEDLYFPGKRGSVAVINYNTNTLVTRIYTGHQPHGLEMDDSRKLVIVANRNASSDGPAPHHSTACGGRNGNISFIDINTLSMVMTENGGAIKKVEVSVDPYSVAIRH
jgi:DNA-binding beta-propeller fold protein YncE